MTDERVEAARAHWAFRFTANGTDYADVDATLRRITSWDDWTSQWAVTAQRYEDIATQADREQRQVTASEAWRRAALCWHWAKFVLPGERAAHDRTVDCFRRGAAGLEPPAERVEIPYQATRLAAYLRRPAGTRRPPAVIMIPGLDSVKEELQATADYLLRRGLAVLAVDGPGQGESEYELPIEPAYERVVTTVVDYLAAAGAAVAGAAVAGAVAGAGHGIDTARLGVFGVSLGGYYAARAAAFEPRLKAAVALSGPYRFDLDWDGFPPQTRHVFQVRSGAATMEQARDLAGELTLERAADRIMIPLLVAYGGQDRLIPSRHAERLVDQVSGAVPLFYPDGNHGLTNLASQSRASIADWLADQLDG
jgi:2,6-dihydroxypseudooxynicotine hydrolase